MGPKGQRDSTRIKRHCMQLTPSTTHGAPPLDILSIGLGPKQNTGEPRHSSI